MLARASSDAGTRLRRSKSTSTVHRHAHLSSGPLDPDVAQQHAVAAATAAFARAQGHDATDRKAKRSSDMSRSKSNASRKSLTSQGSHFPPRDTSFRSLQAPKTGQTSSTQRQYRAPTINTEQFPPFYPTTSSDRPVSVTRPLSAQPSVTFSGNARPGSEPKSQRQSALSSVTSQQIRKARSMYYASSIQTGSPIARPPAKYLTTPPSIPTSPPLESSPAIPPTRALGPSPLAGPRIPITVAADETVDEARDKYLQSFQHKTVKHKPSKFLAPFKKRQDKEKEREKGQRITSGTVSVSVSNQQAPDESAADTTLSDFLPQPEIKEKRSFSGSLKSKFKKVFGRTSNKSPRLPVQQIEASRDYFGFTYVSPPNVDDAYEIPSPDDYTLRRVRSRTPSVEAVRPAFIRSGSRTSSNGSGRSNKSNRSLHSETNATNASGSRVTSWGTSSSGDTLTQRAMKRLTVIHEAKDSIGSEAERAASMVPKRKSLPLPAFTSFRDPMPMESLTEESLTPVDPKRVFSALMREIGTSRSAQAPTDPVNRTPGAESDVFESSDTKGLHLHTRDLHSSASRDFQPSIGSDQRPPSRRAPSAAAQSAQSKSSTIRSLGRAIRSTIRTVTPVQQSFLSGPDHPGSVRGPVRIPRDDIDTPSSTAASGSEDSDNEDQRDDFTSIKVNTESPSGGQDYSTDIFTPSAAQIEKRVEKARDRWKTPLEEGEKLQFPRETDRTYNITNFAQQTTSGQASDDPVDHIEASQTGSNKPDRDEPYKFPSSPKSPGSPVHRPVMSPLSPSLYSRNTDGISILPNDSVMSFSGPEEHERPRDGGSAVILTSQSVRSYVIGTPSPHRRGSTRTSRDWKTWLSHEISGMESTSQEDLRIHEHYVSPSGQHMRDITRMSHTDNDEHGDTTVILRESRDISTPRVALEPPTATDALKAGAQPSAQDKSIEQEYFPKATMGVLERSESHPDTFKEVSPGHTPPMATNAHPRRFSSRPGSTPLSNRQPTPSTPGGYLSASQPVAETPKSARMNERFPFIKTDRRSSSNSARSSRHSKSPPDSVASLKSMNALKATPSPKIYSDLSVPATNQLSQRVSNAALKRSDAQYKRKENLTPPSLGGNSKPSNSSLGLSSRPMSLQPLSSAAPNQSTSSVGQYMSTAPEIDQVNHKSSPTATLRRPRIRASLRPISPEKLSRRPKSAFDLRGTNTPQTLVGPGRTNDARLETPSPRSASKLRRPALHLKTSSTSLALSKEPSPGGERLVIDSVIEHERSGSVTPGQRMADRFLKERKSTPMLESGKRRGGLKLVREDTPAFL